MKIEKYEMEITIDIPHNWKRKIIEFWIPPVKNKHKGIVFNFEGSDDTVEVNCWFENKPRYKAYKDAGKTICSIDFDDNIAETMYDYLKIRQRLVSYKKLNNMNKQLEQERKTILRAKMVLSTNGAPVFTDDSAIVEFENNREE